MHLQKSQYHEVGDPVLLLVNLTDPFPEAVGEEKSVTGVFLKTRLPRSDEFTPLTIFSSVNSPNSSPILRVLAFA